MKRSFNLKKYIKKAFYDDDRGYWNKQTRAWMNCYKSNLDDGKSPHDAWNGCLESYQTANEKADWALKYASMNKKKKL